MKNNHTYRPNPEAYTRMIRNHGHRYSSDTEIILGSLLMFIFSMLMVLLKSVT